MMILRCGVAALLLVAPGMMHAQSAPPTVEEVLARVRATIKTFRETLPNVGSDETVVSDELHDGESEDETTIVSTFRITRGKGENALNETRTKLTMNGKPVKNQNVAGPFNFNGGIVGVLQLPEGACHAYRLETEAGDPEEGKIVLSDHGTHLEADQKTCGKSAFVRRLTIDPVSFQVLHLELREEDIQVGMMARMFFPVGAQNIFTTSTDLAPVMLGAQTFWLPTHVTATLAAKRKPVAVRYNATYTNYHRFAATVTIGPATQVPSQP